MEESKQYPPDKWKTDKITSELLRYKTGVGFQQLESSLAQEVISKFKEVTRGFIEDFALRERYQKEGLGLETVFEKQEWAVDRAAELKQIYGLTDADIRLVKHISTPETGEKPTWEVYVKAGKGLSVLFLKNPITGGRA